MLESFGLLNKIITYIQNEVFNYLTSLAMALTSMVSCYPLNLTTLFISYCFKHVMSKTTLYTTNDFKFVMTWLKWAWSKLKVPYRLPSPRLKSLSKVCRDGKTCASMLFFLLKYSRHSQNTFWFTIGYSQKKSLIYQCYFHMFLVASGYSSIFTNAYQSNVGNSNLTITQTLMHVVKQCV